MVKFSVIIPVYNASKTLDICLTSVLNQTIRDYEVIVVDDCSADNSEEIIKSYQVNLIKLDKNSGSGIARNEGAKISQGKFLMFIDSDIIVQEDWLEKIEKDFRELDTDIVSGTYGASVGNSFLEKFAFYELLFRRPSKPGFVNSFPSNNFAIKKEVFKELNGFPTERNFFAEDLEFGLKASIKYKIFWDPSIKVSHHFHTSLWKYLKQQYRFARDTIRVYKRNKWFSNITRKENTYQGEKNKITIALTALSLFISIFFLINIKFLYSLFILPLSTILDASIYITFLKEKKPVYSLYTLLTLILRNIVWVIGMIIGVFKK